MDMLKEAWAVRTELGWTVSRPLPKSSRKELKVSSNLSVAQDSLTEQVKSWWDIESYASNCKTTGRSKDDKAAEAILQNSLKLKSYRFLETL